MTTSQDLFEDQREFELMQSIPVTKAGIAIKATTAVDKILETGNPLEYAQTLSAMEGFISAVKKDERFIEAVIDEARKDTGKVTLPSGAKIEVCEVGTKYDYSHDETWAALEIEIQARKAVQKEREDYLKKIPAGKQIIDEDGVILGVGPAKSSTTSFKVTLAK